MLEYVGQKPNIAQDVGACWAIPVMSFQHVGECREIPSIAKDVGIMSNSIPT